MNRTPDNVTLSDEESSESVLSVQDEFRHLLSEAHKDPRTGRAFEDALQRTAFLDMCRTKREGLSLRQQDVAEAMATSQSAVSDFEAGRSDPQVGTAQRYARALGCRFDFALTDAKIPYFGAGSHAAFQEMIAAATLSPLLTTLVRNSEENARTLEALSNALAANQSLAVPPGVIKGMLNHLQDVGWASSNDDDVYTLENKAAHVIGLSLHSDRLCGVLIDLTGSTVGQITAELEDTSPDEVLRKSLFTVKYLFSLSSKPVLGVGVAVAGVVDSRDGIVRQATELSTLEGDDWRDVAFEQLLERRIHDEVSPHLRVVVENDANCLAAKEYLTTGSDSVATFLLTNVGVGAGFVFDGRPLHGARSSAGEIGHFIVDKDGRQCRRAKDHGGCLETLAIPDGILDELRLPYRTPEERIGSLAAVNKAIISGEETAISVVRNAGQSLGTAISLSMAFLDPSHVSVYASQFVAGPDQSGEIFRKGVCDVLTESFCAHVTRYEFAQPSWSELADDTVAVAAAQTAFWHFLRRPQRWAPSVFPATNTGTSSLLQAV